MRLKNKRIIAELAQHVAETAVLTAAARVQGIELEVGALYLHRSTAPYDVEWAVLERDDKGPSRAYVVAADSLTLIGRYDVLVAPSSTCGALSLRCAMGVWVPTNMLLPELCSGSIPNRAVERARVMCRQARRRSSKDGWIDPADGVLTPDWDPEAYRERLQQVAVASRLLESLAADTPRTAANGFEVDERGDEIAALYETIARRCETVASATGADDAELSLAWARLRRLQTEEADRYQEAFESSLAMPIDAGKVLLEQARALRQRFENPAADD